MVIYSIVVILIDTFVACPKVAKLLVFGPSSCFFSSFEFWTFSKSRFEIIIHVLKKGQVVKSFRFSLTLMKLKSIVRERLFRGKRLASALKRSKYAVQTAKKKKWIWESNKSSMHSNLDSGWPFNDLMASDHKIITMQLFNKISWSKWFQVWQYVIQ